MRRWMMILAALSLALLTACAQGGGDTLTAGPAVGLDDAQGAGPGDNSQTDPQTPGETGGQEGRPLYVFVGGQLVGSWEDGQWISAVPLGEYEDGAFVSAGDGASRDYTLAELLAEDGYYTYTQDGGETVAHQCELYTLSDGPGSFDWDLRDTVKLLDDYALSVPEEDWERRTFALPTVLEGEAAELPVPDYSFSVTFDGVYPEAAVSRPLAEPPVYPEDADGADWRETVDACLAQRGVAEGAYQVSGLCRGGDGSVYLAVNSACDEMGYWLGDSEQVFSLVLCRRSDGAVEEVYWRSTPYTSDATSLFRIWLNSVCDLNGDGEPEVLLRDGRWEWGHVYVMARDGDGAWQRVLQADSGM